MIKEANKKDYPALKNIWENSVKATHHFLSEEDFKFYQSKIVEEYFPQLKLYYSEKNNIIAGFIGVDKNKLEMLFVDDKFRGKGIGKELLLYAVDKLRIKKVDVNEQNEQAIGFYKRFGFIIEKRSEYDGEGKAYPILQMSL
ncbi:MAG: GNAT family N-acetyltransferase [Dysgonomonas sp.]